MTTFAFIFKANFIRPRYFVHVGLLNTFAHCARRIRDHPRFRNGDENDRICPRSWSALNHRDGPRTVDIFLERIADIAFSVWTIG